MLLQTVIDFCSSAGVETAKSSQPSWRSGIRDDLELSSFEDLEGDKISWMLGSLDRLMKFR